MDFIVYLIIVTTLYFLKVNNVEVKGTEAQSIESVSTLPVGDNPYHLKEPNAYMKIIDYFHLGGKR